MYCASALTRQLLTTSAAMIPRGSRTRLHHPRRACAFTWGGHRRKKNTKWPPVADGSRAVVCVGGRALGGRGPNPRQNHEVPKKHPHHPTHPTTPPPHAVPPPPPPAPLLKGISVSGTAEVGGEAGVKWGGTKHYQQNLARQRTRRERPLLWWGK